MLSTTYNSCFKKGSLLSPALVTDPQLRASDLNGLRDSYVQMIYEVSNECDEAHSNSVSFG